MSKAEQRALEAYPIRHKKVWNSAFGRISFDANAAERKGYKRGYRQASKDIISLIESRIAEILGDAQPAPVLRAELRELIDKIREESK